MDDQDKIRLAVGPQAEANIGAEAQRRAQNCLIDIQNSLKRWKCVIDPRVMISGNEGIRTTFAVIPLVERPTG